SPDILSRRIEPSASSSSRSRGEASRDRPVATGPARVSPVREVPVRFTGRAGPDVGDRSGRDTGVEQLKARGGGEIQAPAFPAAGHGAGRKATGDVGTDLVTAGPDAWAEMHSDVAGW